MIEKKCKDSLVISTDIVFPEETNDHNTLFGGLLMMKIDEIAYTSARRHCRTDAVTASTDSVDFLKPIKAGNAVCLESFVTWTGKSSMEVFVKVITEDLKTGEREIAATSFLTFVALDNEGKATLVPKVVPETSEEKKLHETAEERAKIRKFKKEKSKELAQFLTTKKPWE